MRGTVIIFAKAPVAGSVKTRLAASVGAGRAASLYRTMMTRIVAEAAKGPWLTIIAVDPPSAMTGWSHCWPPRLARMAQEKGDLGQRMAQAMARAPVGPVVVIGADATGLRQRDLRNAFEALAGADAVFGPAEDGGYWLLGLARRRGAPALFDSVRWSTRHALADTRASLPAGFRVATLRLLTDIDEARDLAAFGLRSVAGALKPNAP